MMTFEQLFNAATGHAPFRWQKRFYVELLKGKIPLRCNIPTGLGKTSIITIWLLALAEQLRNGSAGISLPRRLVYIVDRRVVVDQATEETDALLTKFKSAAAGSEPRALGTIARCLAETGCLKDTDPFAVSTLRGQHADNRLWLRDATRPAVIIGTVDMIGSRLLFSGYGGLGRYSRSLHAGLLAQDALIVLDEAHLSPSFVETLGALDRQLHRSPSIKPFHVMLLSATQLPAAEAAVAGASLNGNDFALQPEHDLKDAEVARRLQAAKSLKFLCPPKGDEPEKPDAVAGRMAAAAVALSRSDSAIVVFANTVELVKRVSKALKSAPHAVPEDHVLTLTGEMRGKERDELVEQSVFARFRQRHRDRAQLDHPIFLVATAAAEVGINFDADHAVCDLVTLERMVQRFGRVNRFGDGAASIRVVLSDGGDNQQANSPQATTLALLQSLPKSAKGFNASPAALTKLITSHSDTHNAFAPRPPCPPLDEARLDDWSLTTLPGRDFARPQVSYWLRGLTPDDTPHTWLAWRADLEYAATADDAAQMAQTIPLRPAELAQVNTLRAGDLIGKLRERAPEAFAALLDPAGNWSGLRLGDLPEKKEVRDRLLRFATVVLPASIGGLKDGLLDDTDKPVRDVVDTNLFQRVLLQRTSDGWRAHQLPLNGSTMALGAFENVPTACRKLPRKLGSKSKFLTVSGSEDEAEDDLAPDSESVPAPDLCRVAYFASPDGAAELAVSEDFASLQRADVPLAEHNAAAADIARRLTAKLKLPAELADAVVQACARHDLGKRQPQWQKAIGNPHGPPLAKSANTGFDRTATGGYRHEFGSLLDAARDPALVAHKHGDLILHLIAAHHGHARPGFSPEAFAILPLQRECAAAVHEGELRFARLQREFGWWQLAYLESLVKCADALASAQADTIAP
jgi:CRISPR-associated endonuclease/helicase Cas3